MLLKLAAAYWKIPGWKSVVVGPRRPSHGPQVRLAVLAGLAGLFGQRCHRYWLGSHPYCGLDGSGTGSRGGIQISASHNPVEWNALKFLIPAGSS
jgi:phosphomannomutase